MRISELKKELVVKQIQLQEKHDKLLGSQNPQTRDAWLKTCGKIDAIEAILQYSHNNPVYLSLL